MPHATLDPIETSANRAMLRAERRTCIGPPMEPRTAHCLEPHTAQWWRAALSGALLIGGVFTAMPPVEASEPALRLQRFAFTGSFRFAARPPLVVATTEPSSTQLASVPPQPRRQGLPSVAMNRPEQTPKLTKTEVPRVHVNVLTQAGKSPSDRTAEIPDQTAAFNVNSIQTAAIKPSPSLHNTSTKNAPVTAPRIAATSENSAANSNPARPAPTAISRDTRSALGASLPASAASAIIPQGTQPRPSKNVGDSASDKADRNTVASSGSVQIAALPAVEPQDLAAAHKARALPPLPTSYTRPATETSDNANPDQNLAQPANTTRHTAEVRRRPRITTSRRYQNASGGSGATAAKKASEPAWMRRALGTNY